MKYIRTDDGIYDETKVNLIADALNGEIFVGKMINGYTSRVKKVIKRADTIEELCDFIFFKYWSTIRKCYELKLYKSLKELYANEYITGNDKYFIYGAIWTDYGLIYVAKMNDKGELELL